MIHVAGRRRRVAGLGCCLLWLFAATPSPGWCQTEIQPLPAPAGRPEATIRMNLQGDVPLDALVGYLSTRLGIRFEYDDAIATRRVTIRTPEEIPVESLPALLGNVLRTEGLALVDSEREGWKRIVEVRQMAPLSQIQSGQWSPRDDDAARLNPATPVTQVFVLENLSAASVADVLQPFLSGEGANLAAVANSNTLIVTDYASSIDTLAALIELVDQPAGQTGFLVYEARNQSADTLAGQASSLLKSAATDGGEAAVEIVPQPLGNRIIVAGSTALVKRADELLQRLDIASGLSTEVYRIRNTSAERIDRLIGGFIEPPNDSESAYQSTVDEEGNLLIVRAPAEVHRQIAELIAELDTAIDSDESPIQFYKLKNASAIDVLYSLLALQEAVGGGGGNAGFYGPFGGGQPNAFPGSMNPAASVVPITPLPLPPIDTARTGIAPARANPLARPTLAAGGAGLNQGATANNALAAGNGVVTTGLAGPGFGAGTLVGGGSAGGSFGAGGVATLPGGARVSADVSTNSLIVFAPASVQSMYAKLIESLDQRRPQVLIEAKVIAVSTTDDYTLGVEVSVGDRVGAKRLFKFSSFGLSEVNPDTGALRIIPGLGFNGTLIDPEVADVVVRALAQHDRSRVLAAPKILVNDNSTGTLESVVSVPFASINASETVATTSLGGDQSAGTIITVTPHINEDDHLQLEFDVEFSTFADSGADGLPPPRQIDRVGSIVTIPSGKTVVVGGLKRITENHNFSGIPWAEKIPVIRELTSRTDDLYQTTSFFLFIRPVVLRDSRFADLKYLSQNELNDSHLPGDFPASRPELIR